MLCSIEKARVISYKVVIKWTESEESGLNRIVGWCGFKCTFFFNTCEAVTALDSLNNIEFLSCQI